MNALLREFLGNHEGLYTRVSLEVIVQLVQKAPKIDRIIQREVILVVNRSIHKRVQAEIDRSICRTTPTPELFLMIAPFNQDNYNLIKSMIRSIVLRELEMKLCKAFYCEIRLP